MSLNDVKKTQKNQKSGWMNVTAILLVVTPLTRQVICILPIHIHAKFSGSLGSWCVAGAAGILPWAPGATAGDSGREVGSIASVCREACADWSVSVILNTSLNLEVSTFSRVWVIYFAESTFSSFFWLALF